MKCRKWILRLWIHACEFVIMKSHMNSWSWTHVWIQCYEEYSEIMAQLLEMNWHMKSWLNSLILNYSWFSFKFVSVKENVLLIQSNDHPFFAVSSWLLLGGNQAALLRQQTSAAAHSRAGRTWMALKAHDGRHWRGDLLSLLVSNKGNFRNLQLERLSKGSTSRTESRRSN